MAMDIKDSVIDSDQQPIIDPGFDQAPEGFNFFKNFFILLGNVFLGAILAALFSLVVAVLWGYGITDLQDLLGGFDTEADPNLMRLILGLNQALTFLLPGLLTAYIVYKRDWVKHLFLNISPATKNWGLGILILLCAMPLVQYTFFLNKLIPLPESWLAQEESAEAMLKMIMTYNAPYELFFNIILIAVLPALGEEIVFRGIFQKNLQWILKNPHVAVWVAAFFFSFIHFQFAGFIPRMLLGAVLGYLFYYTQNLWVPIIAHFFNNGLQVLMDFFYKEEMSSMDIESIESVPWYAALISLIIVCVLIAYLRKVNIHKTDPQLHI
jgi:membrane protease YdiL (CAAX protease family)